MNHMSKVAIITGASRGIGWSIAQRLAANGFAVIVDYAGNTAAAEQTVQGIRQAGFGFCGKIVTELYGQIEAYAYGLQMIGNPVPVIAARA